MKKKLEHFFPYHFSKSFTAKDYGSLMSFDSDTTQTVDGNKEENSSRRKPNPSWKLNSNSLRRRNNPGFVSSAKDKVIRKSNSFSGKFN